MSSIYDLFSKTKDAKSITQRLSDPAFASWLKNALRTTDNYDKQGIPDTFGCDSIFTLTFLTDEMSDDFELIANEFLCHEMAGIKNQSRIEYIRIEPKKHWPGELYEYFVLNLIMNAANSGSSYARDLLLNLHKTYYKKEYKQLKRFSRISLDEVIALSNTDGCVSPQNIARILTISRLQGIEIGKDCDVLYLILSEYMKIFYKEDKPDSDPDRYSEAGMHYLEEAFPDTDIFEEKHKFTRFTRNLLQSMDFANDFLSVYNESADAEMVVIGRVISALKKTFPKRDILEFPREEVLLFAELFHILDAFVAYTDEMAYVFNCIFFGRDIYGNDAKQYRFDPASISRHDSPVKNEPKAAPQVRNPEESANYNEQELLDEIKRLQQEVHRQETEIRQLREDAAANRKQLTEQKEANRILQKEHSELISLRNYAYKQTDQDNTESGVLSIDEMTSYIKDKNIVIIGGHSNWISKLKNLFPGWRYVKPEISGTLNPRIVENADYVYFFTDTISHGTYFKYIDLVRNSIPFSYIHSINLDKNIAEIYSDLINEKGTRT